MVFWIEEEVNMNVLYLCDPDKNPECKKTNCFLNGGGCKSTFDLNKAKQPLTTVTLGFNVTKEEFEEITKEVDQHVKPCTTSKHGKKHKRKHTGNK
jgi:hypothetical protein